MKKPLILLAACLTLAVAAKPGAPKLGYDSSVFAGSGGPYVEVPGEAGTPPRTYRPCRPGRGDDNCIQLYERRVRAALPRTALRPAPRPAIGGPIEGPASYPACSRVITDECVQLFDRSPRRAPPARRAAPARRAPQAEANTPGI